MMAGEGDRGEGEEREENEAGRGELHDDAEKIMSPILKIDSRGGEQMC